MIRIGVVNIDVSHPKAFAEYFANDTRARYVAVYNDSFREEDEVQGFMNEFGLEKRFHSINEMADFVDVGFIQGCNWDQHIKEAMPFIERNKPVFIDKPIVGSLADCRKLEQLAAQGAIILGSSSVRYAEEIEAFLAEPTQERGEIMTIYGTAGVDEFNYAIHIVEAIHQLAGAAPQSTKYVGRADKDKYSAETFFVKFENGITATYNTFHNLWQPFELVIMTTKKVHQFRIDNTKIYGALLDRICDFLETGQNSLAPVEKITEAIKIMLSGRISKERGGEEIKLKDLPADDPGFDGELFTREYAAKATKIYI